MEVELQESNKSLFLTCSLLGWLLVGCGAGHPHVRWSWCGRAFFAREASGASERDPLIATGGLVHRDFDRAKSAVLRFVSRIVGDHILSTQITDDLVRDLRQLGD